MRLRVPLLLSFFAAACGGTGAGPEAAPSASPAAALPSLDAPLPMDPGVTLGTLPNGLKYFIEPNGQPQKRAVLHLVVKAGSVLEDDDQLGLAHFVEHMAFNGTTHFPGNELVRRLESFGLRFGAHVNAQTGFDETTFVLQVPTDDPTMLDQALLVMADWASGVTFDPDEVERERGVTLEEWRQTRGAGGRTMDKLIPLTFHGSRYVDRLPIGTEESLRGFSRDALVRFYRDWYRPDLMAVIAVGDVDPRSVEKMIRERFSPLTNPAPERERVFAPIPPHAETLYGIVADPEIPATSVAVMLEADDVEGDTHGAYRGFMVENLAALMINERFSDIAREKDPPFLGGGMGKQRLTPTEGAEVLGAAVKEGEVARGLTAVLVEIERLRRFGFNAAELARAKAKQRLVIETYHTEKKTTDSGTHAEEIIRHFTTGEPMPGIDYEFALGERFLPEIGIAEVNAHVARALGEASRVINVVMPQKEGLAVPTTAKLEAAVAGVAGLEIAAPAEEEVVGTLVRDLPLPGRVVTEETSAELGTTTWRLQNGLTVVFKPTDFRADNLDFAGFSWGGHSLASDADYVAAATAAEIVGRSGLGDFDSGRLGKILAGRKAGVMPWVTEIQEGLRGSASPEDLELAFQLIYSIMTAPRFDANAFALAKEGRRQALLNRLATPAAVFTDAYTALLWRNHPRYRPWTVETLAEMDLDKSARFFRARFSNAAEFTFIFVGTFTVERMRPLVLQYLGALPGVAGQAERPADFGARRIAGVRKLEVRAGIEPKSEVRITFHGPFVDTRANRYAIRSLADVLEVLMREELREALGGTYGVGVVASLEEAPESAYELGIGFGCDPDRVEELVRSAEAIVERVKVGPVEASVIDNLKRQQLREHETQLRDNGFWLGALSASYRRGEPPAEILRLPELVATLTPQVVLDAAQRYIDLGQQLQVTLKPAAPQPASPKEETP